MAERSNRRLFWGLALVGATLDQVAKYLVFLSMYNQSTSAREKQGHFEILPGIFELLTQFTGEKEQESGFWATLRTLGGGEFLPKVNQGALFGFLAHHQGLANTLFAAISIVAAIAIIIWARKSAAQRDINLTMSLGLILAGTLGNLYDRLVFTGVRDFLHLHYQTWEWPVFNVADCCLVCGACLLLHQAFLGRSVKVVEAPATSQTSTPQEQTV